MPVVPLLPAQPLIIALRGKLDFYTWRTLICVRTWPRRPNMPRAPAVRASAAAFADYSRRLKAIDGTVLTAAQTAAAGTRWTWKDITTRAAYGHLNRLSS